MIQISGPLQSGLGIRRLADLESYPAVSPNINPSFFNSQHDRLFASTWRMPAEKGLSDHEARLAWPVLPLSVSRKAYQIANLEIDDLVWGGGTAPK